MKKLFVITAIAAQLIINNAHGLRAHVEDKYGGSHTNSTIPFEGYELWDEFFTNYPLLKTITIPKIIQAIKYECFKNLDRLKHVSFEDDSKLTIIERGAFEDCFQLQSITIPETLSSLGAFCFSCCFELTNVNF
jgi:hypothetical protein